MGKRGGEMPREGRKGWQFFIRARCLAKFLLLLYTSLLVCGACPIKAAIGDRCTVDKPSSHSRLGVFAISRKVDVYKSERGERETHRNLIPSLFSFICVIYNMWSERLVGLVGNPLTRWNRVDVGAFYPVETRAPRLTFRRPKRWLKWKGSQVGGCGGCKSRYFRIQRYTQKRETH